ncbi:hypothetical protein C7S14_7646 [Burkholderia cepacia]|nr:hypothetical protein C7S14_7646 [Burkholderia cepacia]
MVCCNFEWILWLRIYNPKDALPSTLDINVKTTDKSLAGVSSGKLN